jgi:hypothetical protein
MCQASNSAIDGAMASHMAYNGNQEDDENSKRGAVEPIPDGLRTLVHNGKGSEIFIKTSPLNAPMLHPFEAI